MVSIYILVDPRDRRVRYVGQTSNLRLRIAAHTGQSVPTSRNLTAWKAELGAVDMAPELIVIGETTDEQALEHERVVIDFYASIGARLLNCVLYGDKPPVKKRIRALGGGRKPIADRARTEKWGPLKMTPDEMRQLRERAAERKQSAQAVVLEALRLSGAID